MGDRAPTRRSRASCTTPDPAVPRGLRRGPEVFADLELSGAFSHSSPLSLEYVLEQLVPEIAAAADGDPATPVPSAARRRSRGGRLVIVRRGIARLSAAP